jgi:hypothetical protein
MDCKAPLSPTSPTASEKKKAAAATGLGGAVKLVVRLFIEEAHYQKLHRVLAEQWKSCHSLTAAVRLMEAHGVKVSPEEEARLQELPEEQMIDALVSRMPQQSREQFEHFFLQLSLIASTTTRLRSALEAGRRDQIEEALDSAENVGILPFLLKMAIVQAGQEVTTKEAEHAEYLKATAGKMSPLMSSAQEANIEKRRVAQVMRELGAMRVESGEKSAKVLLSMTSASGTTLLHTVLSSWRDTAIRLKREEVIVKEYQEELDLVHKRLHDYKEKQLKNIKGVLNREMELSLTKLLQTAFNAIKTEKEDNRIDLEVAAEAAELEQKLKTYADTATANATRFLTRMNAGNDESLITFVFTGWTTFSANYKRDKELEDKIKASEQKMNEFMTRQGDSARGVLQRMTASSNSGIVQGAFKEWAKYVIEDKEQRLLEENLSNQLGKLGTFAERNKGAAMQEMMRAAVALEGGSVLTVFGVWKREAKVERLKKLGREKSKKKQEQLSGVKGLFKDFASELETGLKEATPRPEPKRHIQDGHKPSSKPTSPERIAA